MDTLTALSAQVIPLIPPAVAVLLWLLLLRAGQVELVLRAVVVGALTAALILLAGAFHHDPRPFVVDPSHPALFPHPADDGFPSDHTALAAAAALWVATVRRRLGLVLLVVAVAGGLARVAANVHHLQDIAAGLLIALVAVVATSTGFRAAHTLARRRHSARHLDPDDATVPVEPLP